MQRLKVLRIPCCNMSALATLAQQLPCLRSLELRLSPGAPASLAAATSLTQLHLTAPATAATATALQHLPLSPGLKVTGLGCRHTARPVVPRNACQ